MLPRAARQTHTVSPAHAFDSTTLTESEIRGLAARFGSPLLVVDCEQVRRQYHSLKAALPGVPCARGIAGPAQNFARDSGLT